MYVNNNIWTTSIIAAVKIIIKSYPLVMCNLWMLQQCKYGIKYDFIFCLRKILQIFFCILRGKLQVANESDSLLISLSCSKCYIQKTNEMRFHAIPLFGFHFKSQVCIKIYEYRKSIKIWLHHNTKNNIFEKPDKYSLKSYH